MTNQTGSEITYLVWLSCVVFLSSSHPCFRFFSQTHNNLPITGQENNTVQQKQIGGLAFQLFFFGGGGGGIVFHRFTVKCRPVA